jgi:hypothetical protein
MISLSGSVLGRASGPSRSQDDDGGGLHYVSWKDVSTYRVFAMKEIYRRRCQSVPGGPTPPGGVARRWLAPSYGAAAS